MDTSTIIGIVILILLIVGFVVLVVFNAKPKCVEVTGVWIASMQKNPAGNDLPLDPRALTSLRITKTGDNYTVEVGMNGSNWSGSFPATVDCQGKISIQTPQEIATAELVGSQIVLHERNRNIYMNKQ